MKVTPEEVLGSSSAVPTVGGAERGHSVMERVRVCFSCGRPGDKPMFTGGHFRFCRRAGRWMSGMANIERYGPAELECDLLRETKDGPGGRVSLPDHRGPRYD